MKKLFAWIKKYETHLSAAAMVAGFIIDNIFFNRIDDAWTHELFIGYLIIAAISIAWLHYLEEHRVGETRWRVIFPLTIQFMLGGLWSGVLIFYSRSATLASSWPFLLVLIGIFFGNEIFKKYHERLVFTTILFFFGLYSYAIFAVPIVVGTLGTDVFLLSGALAVALFSLFLFVLRQIGRTQFLIDRGKIRLGAGIILVLINIFYFTNILPPLPLALMDGGMYHQITKTSTGYEGSSEREPWYVSIGLTPIEHVASGESLFAYGAVFAPVALHTKIIHRWERYDTQSKKWVLESLISFSISGGRGNGYRGYSVKESPQAGAWRVDIETVDGRLIGRIPFKVVPTATPVPTSTKVLK